MRREEKPTRCHWMLYCPYDMLNMFRALPCTSSGALYYMCVIAAYGVQCCKGESRAASLFLDAHPACPAPDLRQPATKVCTVFHTHLDNTLSTHTTTSNPLTLTLLTLHTVDTLYPLLSLGTHAAQSPQNSEHTWRYLTLIISFRSYSTAHHRRQ